MLVHEKQHGEYVSKSAITNTVKSKADSRSYGLTIKTPRCTEIHTITLKNYIIFYFLYLRNNIKNKSCRVIRILITKCAVINFDCQGLKTDIRHRLYILLNSLRNIYSYIQAHPHLLHLNSIREGAQTNHFSTLQNIQYKVHNLPYRTPTTITEH